MEEETNQTCSLISMYIYKAFLSSSLPFFKISLKVKRRKSDTERPRVSGNFLLSVDDREENLERESVLARACELPIGLLIGSNIFSRGEFLGKRITSKMKISVL